METDIKKIRAITELDFLKQMDENFCTGDVLFGDDDEQKIDNFTAVSAMISTRINELEYAEGIEAKEEARIEAEGLNREHIR